MAVNLHTTHFRFGINELAESTHGWHAALDTNPAQGVIAVDTTFLLRFTVQETGGTAAGNTDQQFRCRLNGGAFQNITTTSSIVKAVTTAVFANGADLTKRLTGTGTFESSGDGGTHDGLSGGAQNDIAASGNSETECALQIVSTDVGNNDVIEFQLTSPDFTITNDVVPTITVSEAAPVEVLPGLGEMVLAGFAAVVAVTANVNVSPGVGALTLEGFAPTVTVSNHQNVSPGTGEITITGFSPVVTIGTNVEPGFGELVLSGFAPTVETPVNVLPGLGELTLTGFAPTVATPVVVSPDVGVLTLTGFAPTVTASGGGGVEVTPDVGVLTLTGYSPTVSVSTGSFTQGITTHSGLSGKKSNRRRGARR